LTPETFVLFGWSECGRRAIFFFSLYRKEKPEKRKNRDKKRKEQRIRKTILE